VSQELQIVGALAVLTAFVAAQLNLMSVTSYRYLILNLAGSAMLAVLAARSSQWGFLLLEGTWSVVSLGAIVTRRN
jgi:hypothetical protein